MQVLFMSYKGEYQGFYAKKYPKPVKDSGHFFMKGGITNILRA